MSVGNAHGRISRLLVPRFVKRLPVRFARRNPRGNYISDEHRARMGALATDFRWLWQDPNRPDRERKRMIRLLIEDVTLIKQRAITLHVRFKGGATQTLTLPQPLRTRELRMIPAEIVAEIDRLLDHHTEGRTIVILNERGLHTGEGKSFHRTIARMRRAHRLKPRFDRLREAGRSVQPRSNVCRGRFPNAGHGERFRWRLATQLQSEAGRNHETLISLSLCFSSLSVPNWTFVLATIM